MIMISRRKLLQHLGVGVLASGLPAISFARADTDVRLVLVILRGAVDGLALAAPYGDGKYARVRGELALPNPGQSNGLLKLDGLFGLHPAMRNTHRWYQDGEALVVHAVASPYRDRSHFDGQDLLENGASKTGGSRDGWLNRAIGPLDSRIGNEMAIALAPNTPLVLRGANSVSSWAPSRMPDADEATLSRIESLYANDEFFATRLAQALSSQDIAGGMGSMDGGRRGNDTEQLKIALQSAAKFLSANDGPNIAVLEAGGWDTHANQGTTNGNLANRFRGLDDGLGALEKGMGQQWKNTVVAVVTEFGRTVEVNGTRGTDHGTATAALLLGGAVNGGRVVTDWPGLGSGDLYEGRDLYPSTDLRSVFKGVLREHLHIADSFIEQQVFPDSLAAPALEGLIRV
jgi:uncharacterized protein (DUF1501 family)